MSKTKMIGRPAVARYENIQVSYWDDPDNELWAPYPHLFYPCLWTNRFAHGVTGLYRVTDTQLMQLAHFARRRQLDQCYKTWGDKVRRFDDAWLWVVNRFPYGCVGPKHLICAIHYLPTVPPDALSAFLDRYLDLIQAMGSEWGIDTLSIGQAKGFPPNPNPSPNPSPIPNPSTPLTPPPKGESDASQKAPSKPQAKPSRRAAFEALRAAVAAGAITRATRGGATFRARPSTVKPGKIALIPPSPEAEPTTLGRGDDWEAYAWT